MDLIRSSPLLSVLSNDEVLGLSLASRVIWAARGEVIWLSRSSVDFFGIAGTGFVKMVRSGAGGTNVTVDLMGPGQVFGLMGAITEEGCPLDAIALTDLWYLRVPNRAILAVYHSNERLKDRLVRRLASRFHAAVDLMAWISTGKVEERIAAVLLLLSESYGEPHGTGVRLRVPLTRQEIGELSGTTAESTIRTMSRWRKEGIVSSERGWITLCDESVLAKLLA